MLKAHPDSPYAKEAKDFWAKTPEKIVVDMGNDPRQPDLARQKATQLILKLGK